MNPKYLPKEHDIQNMILEYLPKMGIFAWRNNTGVTKNFYTNKQGITSERFWRAGVKGMPDILGVHRATGRFIAIEVKRPGGKLTKEQAEMILWLRECNAIAFVADSLETLQQGLADGLGKGGNS